MLLDPFEEQLDLPSAPIKRGDGQRGQGNVVGQKNQCLARFRILEANAAQRGLEVLARVEAGENDRLIADQSGAAIHRMRVAPFGFEIRFATGHEEAADLVETIQPFEVEEAPIHDVKRAGLWQQLVEDVDLVHLAIADMDKRRDIATQIEQRVQLDRCLGRAERCPREHRQTQIDGGKPTPSNRHRRARAHTVVWRFQSGFARMPCSGIDPGRRTTSLCARPDID